MEFAAAIKIIIIELGWLISLACVQVWICAQCEYFWMVWVYSLEIQHRSLPLFGWGTRWFASLYVPYIVHQPNPEALTLELETGRVAREKMSVCSAEFRTRPAGRTARTWPDWSTSECCSGVRVMGEMVCIDGRKWFIWRCPSSRPNSAIDRTDKQLYLRFRTLPDTVWLPIYKYICQYFIFQFGQ